MKSVRDLFEDYLGKAQSAYEAFATTGGVQTAAALAAKNARSLAMLLLQVRMREEGIPDLRSLLAGRYVPVEPEERPDEAPVFVAPNFSTTLR